MTRDTFKAKGQPPAEAQAQGVGEVVAWEWEYVGYDPYPRWKTVARALHEMNPQNPPYPETWRPTRPLVYGDAPPPAPNRRSEMDHIKTLQRMRNESWNGSPEATALDAAIQALRAEAELSEAARCAADAIAVLLPLLSSEQREVVCDAIAGADEARADILRALAQQPAAPVLAKHQPCGCVICTCEDEQQCQGCGAKHCGNRADHPPYVGQQTAAVDDLMNAWRAAFITERATRYREGGMKIEQARIHAETDATLMEKIARQQQGGES